MTTDRRDPMARALGRILATVDLTDIDLPAPIAEAIEQGRSALAARDTEYTNCVVVIGESAGDATQWAERNQIDGGARCWPIVHGSELRNYVTPFTIVVLPGAADRDDWPHLAGQIAAFGAQADVIRIRG